MHNSGSNLISTRIAALQENIADLSIACGRKTNSVQLLAVSKTRTAAEIRLAIAAGCSHFGESYLQDALPKISALTDCKLVWHFIGPIQSNKTAAIAENFHWVHSLDRLKIAQRLSDQRPYALAPLQVCLQINTSGEKTKSGISINEAYQLASEISLLPRLQLRGLMTIPQKANHAEDVQRQPFQQLRELLNELNKQKFQLDTLSMGMTNDMAFAIEEGATIVRVGSGIFGERDQTNKII